MIQKKFRALLLAALMLVTLVLASACEGKTPTETTSPDLEYQVNVVDALGTPYTNGVIVRILQQTDAGQQQIAMIPISEEGIVKKTLLRGTYQVELIFTGDADSYYYDPQGLVLTEAAPMLEINLNRKLNVEASELNVQGASVQAYPLSAGSTYVNLNSGEMNYFLFTPEVAGTYAFSLQGQGAQIGYYGAPHFVQENHAAEEVKDNSFTISVKAGMIGNNGTGTTVLVLGVASETATDGVVCIERIGEPEHTVEDEPWTVYETTVALQAYTLPDNAKLTDFDITAGSYNLVLNEQDGFYHLNSADGPLVLVKLGNKSDYKYLDPFETIIDKSRVCKYFYDDSHTFIKKESYNECLYEYIEVMDSSKGVYPLTEDLKYIIQQRGDYYGWFDETSSQYLFRDENDILMPNVNAEYSWLFMCCYLEG